MLDLSTIPMIDNHCHPVLRNQHLDLLQFRSFFSEASSPIIAQQHVPHTIYYLWMLRQLASLYHCEPTEEAILTTHNTLADSQTLLPFLFQKANIATLIVDIGHPVPDLCYTPQQMQQMSGCRIALLLRLEVLMQNLILAYADFGEFIDRFREQVRNARSQGYCGLKSIVAYRSGLAIRTWTKDQAYNAFQQARTEVEQHPNTSTFRLTHKALIDYLLHIAFQEAAQQNLPIQFHTGYGDSDTNLLLGNPLHLRDVLECSDYQTMPVILLHESYPYCQQGAYLAAIYPNVYFDLSYAIPFIEKSEMLNFTRQALSVAPASKLLYSSDGIYIPEMHRISAQRGRNILAIVLEEMIAADELGEQQAYLFAHKILHDTASIIYRL